MRPACRKGPGASGLDEIGVYLQQATVADDVESRFTSLYDHLCAEVGKVSPGEIVEHMVKSV